MKGDFGKFLNLLAFIGIIMVAVALLIAQLANWFGSSGGSLVQALTLVANFIAYLITAIAAFYYVRSKKNVWVTVVFIIALIVMFVFMFLVGLNVGA